MSRVVICHSGQNTGIRAEATNPALGFSGISTFMNVGEAMAAGIVSRASDAPGGFSV